MQSVEWVALQKRFDAVDQVVLDLWLDGVFASRGDLLHQLLYGHILHALLSDYVSVMAIRTLAVPLQIVLPAAIDELLP